ncbi:hypothetical protein [uncultured Limimaricola sp.]|uniref:hypothetical protein n=1 Tax=uncultured Limimaricola sp. TaxID=2211667 RepID=UPI0030FBFE25
MNRITSTPSPEPARIARAAIWGGAMLFAVWALLAGFAVAALGAVGAMVLAGLLPLYTRVSGIVMPRGLATGILVYCLCAFGLGEAGGFYRDVALWDTALHALASAVLALVGVALALLPTAGAAPRTAPWILGLLGVGFAALVGAAWEMFEFGIDALFGTNAQRSGLPDTMGDIAANIAGATYGAIAAQRRLWRGTRLPLSGLLVRFLARNRVIYGDWTGRLFAPHNGPHAGLKAPPRRKTRP